MASPQIEDGHIDIAHELAEALMRTNLNAYQWRVIWAIWRKTYGWHKKEERITNKQFVAMTGISKQHVSRTINELKKRNIVALSGYKIAFNKDYTQWRELPSQATTKNKYPNQATEYPNQATEYPNQATPVTSLGYSNDSKAILDNTSTAPKETLKRNFLKETSQKKLKKDILSDESDSTPAEFLEISGNFQKFPRTQGSTKILEKKDTNPDIKRFIDWYSDRFLSTFNEKPVIEGGKDGTIVKRLLGSYGLDKLKVLAEAFFESDDEWIKETGYTLGVFSKVINKLIVSQKGRKNSSHDKWAGIEKKKETKQ